MPSMALYGLSTMESLVALQPTEEKHSLRTALVQSVVRAAAAVQVRLTPTRDSILEGPPLDLCFNVTMAASELEVAPKP